MWIYFLTLIFPVISYYLFRRKQTFDLTGEHCLITGGSSGIGLALAKCAARLGANITIIARSKVKLEVAKEDISSQRKNLQQKILTFSEDVSKENCDLKNIVNKAEEEAGPITILVNCAGTSVSYEFEETSNHDFSSMMNVNYFGSMRMTQAVLPLMKSRQKGRIVFVSSLAGLIGLYGYSAYSGSKFALQGAAQALHMEVKPFNIGVTLSCPPDTDTPGFAEEIKTKPLETSQISNSGGLFSADQVASKTLEDALKNKFLSSVGFEGWMLTVVAGGTAPVNSIFDLVVQVLTMGIFRLAIYIYHMQCSSTIKKCAEEKNKGKISSQN